MLMKYCWLSTSVWLFSSGKKFDLRVYALVTSYSPLTVYLSRTGFARFTSTRFTMNPEDISNACTTTCHGQKLIILDVLKSTRRFDE
jgi:hypothetical protein